jgi:hypothetical protein
MPLKFTFWYSTADDDDYRYKLQPHTGYLPDVAVFAAEDYHSNHDGWESNWPLLFTIYEGEEGPAVARFEVELESIPQFHAWERDLPVSVNAVPSPTDEPPSA